MRIQLTKPPTDHSSWDKNPRLMETGSRGTRATVCHFVINLIPMANVIAIEVNLHGPDLPLGLLTTEQIVKERRWSLGFSHSSSESEKELVGRSVKYPVSFLMSKMIMKRFSEFL